MGILKLKVNIKEQIFEAQGDEASVQQIFEEFIESTRAQPKNIERTHAATLEKIGKRASQKSESYESVQSLQLGGNDAEIGLAEFLEEKKPKNAFERNAVFVYYLQRVAGIPNITLQHIYTCYRYAGLKPPIAFRQSIVDTSYKKQWLNTASLHSIALTMKGTTFVEHDLPSH